VLGDPSCDPGVVFLKEVIILQSDLLEGLTKEQRDALKRRLARRRGRVTVRPDATPPASPAGKSIVDWMDELIREDQDRQNPSPPNSEG